MGSGSVVSRHQGLINEFRRRFPLFNRVAGRFGQDAPEERVPWFLGFILAAAAKPGPGACCFVLNKTAGTTVIVSILAAMMRFQSDFPRLAKDYAKTALIQGQRVKVKPGNLVYEYAGLWEDMPGFFRLKVLGEDAWRSVPLTDVLRLEPTDRERPKGTCGPDLGKPERSLLDHLLDVTTSGNNSVIRNTVLVNMSQSEFARIVEAITLAPDDLLEFPNLSDFLPWGAIGHDGALKTNDHYQVIGEPLIAATSVPEDLALACSVEECAQKVVFSDGARKLARDLQAFDDISARQRLVILASPNENEALDLLRNRECPIWHMSAEEILVGELSTDARPRNSFVGATIRAADVHQRCKVRIVECQDDLLQSVALSLEKVAQLIRHNEDANEADELLHWLYRLLLECSESCFGVPEDVSGELREVRECMEKHAMWLERPVAGELQQAIVGLEHAATSGVGEGKADKLLDTLSGCNGEWSVVTRVPKTAERLREALKDFGASVPVVSIEEITAEHEYCGIVLPAWPNGRRFTRLKTLSVTPEICVLVYPFESKWVLRHQKREHEHIQRNRMDAESRSSILGIEPSFFAGLDKGGEESESPPEIDVPLDLPIFEVEARVSRRHAIRPATSANGEESREAQFIRFFGGCYAILTEWVRLPVLNEAINAAHKDEAKIRHIMVPQLSIGDFVLFREGRDIELTRLIAEDILGIDKYCEIRNIASRWKSSLLCLGSDPATVQQRLAAHGFDRTHTTIAGWLGNPDRIGPAHDEDIETIAKIAEDTELLSMVDEVRKAISDIRGAHIQAGKQLTELILGELHGRLNTLGDEPVLLDLDYGQAWIIQVESVDAELRKYASNQVNRLQWTTDSAF